MDIDISETPERWVILRLPEGAYKVFATWRGGYLDGDRWKINSGIKEIKKDGDFYYFIGFSGSCYKCHKNAYGVASSWCADILDKIIELGAELMDDMENWSDIDIINNKD